MTSTLLEFTFAETSHNDDTKGLLLEARQLTTVLDADIIQYASLDAAQVKAWVEVAVIGLPFLVSVVTLIRKRGLKGVKLRVGDVVLSADQASTDDLKALIAAAKEKRS